MSNLNSARWEQVQSVFHTVAEALVGEREAVLRGLCAGDEALAAQVCALLEEDWRGESMLDQGLGPLALTIVTDEFEARLGQQIGPYRILQMLGEGGMGVVYLAERTDIGGLVAIKLLRDAWLSPARRRRFASEQKTLAQLNHPGIARLYDADTLADGTPWFVMEYVDGLPLIAFWQAQSGTVEECLRLFRRICEAVLYAHGHAIIHRDLKPSNVLVTAAGAVKLLDFGIAKDLLETEDAGDVTVTGLRAMTPAYAAPEQQDGSAVGVFTDVYALGILLYELLTGKLPHDRAAVGTRWDLEAARPSSLAKADRFTAAVTSTEWADLNVLCLTAMRQEVVRRYQSVEALIRDVDAFLAGRPLEARVDSRLYRVGKFGRRHRAGLTYATVTVLLIAAIIGFFTLRLERARKAALEQAARTQRIQQFTANLFQGGDVSAGPTEDLKVTTLLHRGLEEVNGLNADPAMQADMRETVGNIYRKLGDPKQADVRLTAALEQRQGFAQKDAQEQRKLVDATISLGLVKMEEAKLDEAERLVQQGLQMCRALPASDAATRPSTATAMVALGSVLEAKGDYAGAIKVLEEALKMQPAGTSAEMAANLRGLANVQFYSAHFAEAEALEKRTLAMHKSLRGEHHPDVAEDLNTLGAIQHELGNLHEAEIYYRSALAITEGWYGPGHPNTAQDLTSLGRTLVNEKKYGDAKQVLERALAIQESTHGHNHPAVASALNELGNLAAQENDYVAAGARYAETLQIWRAVYGDHHQFIGVGLSNMGSVYMGQKDYVRAEMMYRKAVQAFTETVQEQHLNTGIAHIKLGRALLRQKRYADAEPETLRGYETLVKMVAPGNAFLVAARKDLEAIYTGLNRTADAVKYRSYDLQKL